MSHQKSLPPHRDLRAELRERQEQERARFNTYRWLRCGEWGVRIVNIDLPPARGIVVAVRKRDGTMVEERIEEVVAWKPEFRWALATVQRGDRGNGTHVGPAFGRPISNKHTWETDDHEK